MSYTELNLEVIRTLTVRALKNFKDGISTMSGSLQAITLAAEVNKVAANEGLKPRNSADPNAKGISDEEFEKIGEVVSNLISEGVLMWHFGRIQSGPPRLRITEYGKKVLDSGELSPHDPNKFLTTFQEEIPEANDLVLKYLAESVETYLGRHLLSSSVMLGVASEAAFYDLFEQLRITLTNPAKKKKFEKLKDDISLRRKFDSTINEIKLLTKLLPSKLQENIESNMVGVFNLIRNQRNDSGHPTGKDISREGVFGHQLLFKMYCRDLYDLVNWLKVNPLWESQLKE